MGSPRVFAIYIGRDFGDLNQGLNETALEMNSFLNSLTTSRYMALLSEYSAKMPQFIGSVYLDNDGAVVTLNADQVQQDLKNVIDYPAASGLYPPGPIVQPDINEVNLLYVLFMPSTTTLQITNRGKTLRCPDICGYHSWGWHNKNILGVNYGKANLFYAAICYPPSTQAVSHELVESITDRSGNGWFSDVDGSEIGDICNECSAGTVITAEGFEVASYWLHSKQRCLQQTDVTPPPTGE
jgi:hypothetical protein